MPALFARTLPCLQIAGLGNMAQTLDSYPGIAIWYQVPPFHIAYEVWFLEVRRLIIHVIKIHFLSIG